ncbi:MAG TPA: hypothetical protein VFC39_10475 [Acidobacteriaceae bacterium]|nr:hypothetical protein [Acidobacteriaceae bacterium]
MRLTLFALPLLIALTPAPQRTNVQARATAHGSCPVSMIAQRRDAGQTMWIVSVEDAAKPKHDEAPKPGSTGLRISLIAPENSPIHQADLAVYFVPPATRALPVYNQYSQYPQKAPKPPAERKKTFHISASDDTSLNLTADLLVGPASGITHIHILSMDYADGTTWTAPNNAACTVAPNGILLVGTH